MVVVGGSRQTDRRKRRDLRLPHQATSQPEQLFTCCGHRYFGTVKPGLGLSHKLGDLGFERVHDLLVYRLTRGQPQPLRPPPLLPQGTQLGRNLRWVTSRRAAGA